MTTLWTLSASSLFIPVILILLRELYISGLREFLAQIKVGMPVSRLATWKTTVQMVAIGIMLGGPAGESQIAWLPESRDGIVVLSNTRGSRATKIVPTWLDYELGLAKTDWFRMGDILIAASPNPGAASGD